MSSLHTIAWRAALLVCASFTLGLPAAQADERQRPGPPKLSHRLPPAPPGHAPRPGHWYDGAHGHRHYYPVTGWRVHAPPRHVHWVPWHGARYGYYNGVWYQPYGATYVVARPPVGIVVSGLPAFATAVAIGGVSYLYANGVYYRDRGDDSYEVVPSPVVVSTSGDGGPMRTFVYPKLGQSAEKQASDEYECHRWAVNQTGFDPSAAAAVQGTGPAQRSDYARAQNACLEGRGYTVR
jgi:hypothetical protein